MTRPRRIVHVVWGAGFGGIERFVSDLARAQAAETPRDPAVAQPAAAPMEVGVMVCGAEPADDSLARYESPDVVVHAGGLRSGFDVRPARLRVVAEELCKYDIVHLHGFMPGASLAVDRARRPVVFTEHGLLGLGRRWPSRAAVKQSAKGVFLRHRVHTVACVSQWVAQEAERKYRLDECRVREVPDGVDFARISAARSRDEFLRSEGVDPTAWVMVVTARLVQFKRIDRLLEAAARMNSAGRDWVLLLAGSGPLEGELRERATTLGIAHRVRFLGYRDDTWDLVAAADLVPVPSEFEAFGLVVVEAMALDRPVVAFADSGGPAEIVQTVGGGRIVQSIDELTGVLEQSRAGLPFAGLRPLDHDLLRRTYSIGAAAAAYAKMYDAACTDTGYRRGVKTE
jgi:glycosyltransferase involved in cell wall biosynthesis